jgi:hypothetical protein
MRDFRDAKAMAQTIRAALAAKGVKLSIGDSLELVAKAFGAADWNTLSAAIRAARTGGDAQKPTAEPEPEKTAAAPDRATQRFSPALEATLHRSVALAQTRSQSYTTLEHLLLALTDDPDALAVLGACRIDLDRLQAVLLDYIDGELLALVAKDTGGPVPTSGFHRVVQRAVIHTQASGVRQVTGAHLLVAMFSETESRACLFMTEQGVTRYDAVNFMVRGIRKGDAAA